MPRERRGPFTTHQLTNLLRLDNIARAAREIAPVFRASHQFEAEALGARLGVRILLKVETANPIRSFKGRGADFYVKNLDPVPERLVTASAGNFGQGLAWAARARGRAPATSPSPPTLEKGAASAARKRIFTRL